VILVGDRAAESSGTLSACLRLAERTGARLAWIPRRAGDRGAVEAGCLPNLLPGGRPVAAPAARVDTQTTWGIGSLPAAEGRDADEMLLAAADDELAALVVAGVEPGDFLDPQAALEGLERIGFVISIETRASQVSERANVVLPVSLMDERAGSFLNWECRDRPFDIVIERPNAISDLRVLGLLADGLGTSLGIETPAQAKAELLELGPWEGIPAAAPEIEPSQAAVAGATTAVLATWRLAIDGSRAIDGEPFLLATARRPVARLNPRTAAAADVTDKVVVSNDRGALTFDVVLDKAMAEGVVWIPRRAPGLAVSEHLAAAAGELVSIGPPKLLVLAGTGSAAATSAGAGTTEPGEVAT
jgi:NADH-quinone oxidoreductase subunit G